MNDIYEVINTLEYPDHPTSNYVFGAMYEKLMTREDLNQGLLSSQFDFRPNEYDPLEDTAPTAQVSVPITPDAMGQLLNVIIRCSEGRK